MDFHCDIYLQESRKRERLLTISAGTMGYKSPRSKMKLGRSNTEMRLFNAVEIWSFVLLISAMVGSLMETERLVYTVADHDSLQRIDGIVMGLFYFVVRVFHYRSPPAFVHGSLFYFGVIQVMLSSYTAQTDAYTVSIHFSNRFCSKKSTQLFYSVLQHHLTPHTLLVLVRSTISPSHRLKLLAEGEVCPVLL